MVAPTEQLAMQERDRAMEMYRQALAAQGRMDDAALAARTQEQRYMREGLLYGEERQQGTVNQATTAKKQNADLEIARGTYT
jgi:hypothetical protein